MLDNKDRSIIREVALKSAVEFWAGQKVEVGSEAILLMAQDFDTWMMAPFQTLTQPAQAAPAEWPVEDGGTFGISTPERPPLCACGAPTQYKSGTSKAGKDYRGFFCTANKDHAPQWV